MEILLFALLYLSLLYVVINTGQSGRPLASSAPLMAAGFVLFYCVWRVLLLRPATADGANLPERLLDECQKMVLYAYDNGDKVPDEAMAALNEARAAKARGALDEVSSPEIIRRLGRSHGDLSELISPARPRTVALVMGEPADVFPWLGRVRLVRMLVGFLALLTPLFVVLGMKYGSRMHDAFGGILAGDPPDKEPAAPVDAALQAGVAIYLMIAAAAGATFAALTKAFSYIGDLTYDERHESSYWVRIALGVIAGVILTTVLNSTVIRPSDDASTITIPLLAVIGGFSSDLVYRILERVIEAVRTVFSGSPNENAEQIREGVEARVRAETVMADAADARLRVEDTARFTALRAMALNESPRISRMIDTMLAERGDTVVSPHAFGDPALVELRTYLARQGLVGVNVDFDPPGTIRLSGPVRSKAEKDHAFDLAAAVCGGFRIDNQIVVDPAQCDRIDAEERRKAKAATTDASGDDSETSSGRG